MTYNKEWSKEWEDAVKRLVAYHERKRKKKYDT